MTRRPNNRQWANDRASLGAPVPLVVRICRGQVLRRGSFGLVLAWAVGGCGVQPIDGIVEPASTPIPSAGGRDAGTGGASTIGSCEGGGIAGFSGTAGPFMTPASPRFTSVITAAEPPPPIAGGTLLVLRDGVTAVAADPDRDRIYVVDVTDVSQPLMRASIGLAPRDQPGRLVQDSAGMVHAVLRNAGALATVDPTSGTVTMRRQVCPLPRGLAYDPARDELHVACAGGEFVSFTPTGATPTRTIKLPQDLRDVVVDGPNLMVSRFRSAEVMILDANGTMLENIRPPSFTNQQVSAGSPFEASVAWRTVASPDGGAVMVHQRGMDGRVKRQPGGYGGFSPCDTIVHTSVTKMKKGQRPVAGPAMPGFPLPVDMALSADGKRVAMVAAGNGHSDEFGTRRLFVTDVDAASGEWEGGCGMDDKHGPAGRPSCMAGKTCPPGLKLCGALCVDAVMICDAPPLSATGGTTGRMSAGAGGAGGTTVGSSGGATGRGGAGGGFARGSGGSIGSSGAPCDGTNDLPGKVEPVAVAFTASNHVLVQTREPAQLWVLSQIDGSINVVSLSQESRADTGHAVFHANSGGGLACASCHPEGTEDGRVWNFECEGERRTQDLSGGISGTEPFHWGGDLKDFPTLVNEVFVGRMSGPSLNREATAAALRWINSVPARAPLRLGSDPQVQRGRAIFHDTTVACATCHAGSVLTNNQTMVVGTEAAFQVPSLRGLGWRAPFMHDGCALTLTGRFGNPYCDGGDAHGKTSHLNPGEIADLVAFLESL